VTDAEELARPAGPALVGHPDRPVVDAFLASVPLTGLSVENLQARVRGTTLMALSNEHGHLVLTTGNKSEAATGFSTLYGDSAGGFAPIKDVPKLLVFALARWRNAVAAEQGEVPPIPEGTINKPPSAELAPGQLDSDRLPPYEVLDPLLDAYVEQDRGRGELVAAGADPQVVDRVIALVDAAEYKRRQSPPGTEDHRPGLRSRPAAAHHLPLARGRGADGRRAGAGAARGALSRLSPASGGAPATARRRR
jgi:NAD+ synthase (glutamine-hydrolysing)